MNMKRIIYTIIAGALILCLIACGSEGKKHAAVTDKSQLYIVGGGIAGLSSAVFAIRDAHVPGKNIHIFEGMKVMGGALDATVTPKGEYLVRGARKWNIKAMNCMWDLLGSIPMLTDPNKTVKDDIFQFSNVEHQPRHYNIGRFIDKDHNKIDVNSLGLTWRDRKDLILLSFCPVTWMKDKKNSDWFAPEFFKSNFWNIFSSMFWLTPQSSAMETKLYARRFCHDFPTMLTGEGEVLTRYNQYESVVLPIQEWLKKQGVNFEMGCKVDDVDFKSSKDTYTVEKIYYTQDGAKKEIAVNEGDNVIVTIGSLVADTRRGSMTEPAPMERGKLDGSWILWENIVKSAEKARSSAEGKSVKVDDLGNPSVFADHIDQSVGMMFAANSKDRTFIDLFEKKTGNKAGWIDLVTFKDSNWYLSIHTPYKPHFINQPENLYLWGAAAVYPARKGNYVNKTMFECTGEDILKEVCAQFGFDEKETAHVLKTNNVVPVSIPYMISPANPRKVTDRPIVVPKASTNLGFIGQYVEVPGECVLTAEISVRTAQEAVYTLLNVDKKVPPIYDGVFHPIVAIKMLIAMMK